MPEVSVAMSVYNGERYLREAIESILRQTFTDFEFILIDDGSSDSSLEIINSYTDARMHLVRNEKNIGLAGSLNRGISIARGEYLARMDTDDVSHPARLMAQVEWLKDHPEVGAVGSAVEIIDDQNESLHNIRFPREHGRLKWLLTTFSNPIVHPSVMMRHDFFRKVGGYNETLSTSQDYDLWVRLMPRTQLSNMDQVLLKFRKHPENVSATRFEEQKSNTLNICRPLILALLGHNVKENALHDLCTATMAKKQAGRVQKLRAVFLLQKLMSAAKASQEFGEDDFGFIQKNTKNRVQNLLFATGSPWSKWMSRVFNRLAYRN